MYTQIRWWICNYKFNRSHVICKVWLTNKIYILNAVANENWIKWWGICFCFFFPGHNERDHYAAILSTNIWDFYFSSFSLFNAINTKQKKTRAKAFLSGVVLREIYDDVAGFYLFFCVGDGVAKILNWNELKMKVNRRRRRRRKGRRKKTCECILSFE